MTAHGLESVNLAGAASWARHLRRSLDQLSDASSPDEWVEAAVASLPSAPAELDAALGRLTAGDVVDNVVLVQGLDHWLSGLQPTPSSVRELDRGLPARASALALLAVLSLLGEPFTFASLYDGKLVQDVLPVTGQEQAQTSEGSDSFLQWHVEDAFTEDRCQYFGLYCLRGDPSAATLFAPARRLRLEPSIAAVLGEPRFVIRPDTAHGSQAAGQVIRVLEGDPDNPEICYDPVYMAPLEHGDREAGAALQALAGAIEAEFRSYVMEPGDLLVVDNRRVVHGRSAFSPRYDGTDRWLMRVMACQPARYRQRGAQRVMASQALAG